MFGGNAALCQITLTTCFCIAAALLKRGAGQRDIQSLKL